MIKTIKKVCVSIRNATKGINTAFWSDNSFQLEVVVGLSFYVSVIYTLWPMRGVELLFLVLSYGIILITELVNTSIETLLERLHPLRHGLIGVSKDIAAGAVLLSAVFAGLVLVIIILARLNIIVL